MTTTTPLQPMALTVRHDRIYLVQDIEVYGEDEHTGLVTGTLVPASPRHGEAAYQPAVIMLQEDIWVGTVFTPTALRAIEWYDDKTPTN